MKNMEKFGLAAFEKTMDVRELKWYLYDIICEVLEKGGIEKKEYSLEKKQDGAVCLMIKAGNWYVCGRAEDRQYGNFYHAACDFFYRVYGDEDKTEEAVSSFLTRTLDLPVMIKIPSISMLENEIRKCQEEICSLEEKLKKEPDKKIEAKLSLNRIYLKGLKEKFKKI